MQNENRAKCALVALADGFEEIEALSVVDVLRRGGVETVVASVSGALDVRGAHGIAVRADEPFAEAEARMFDAIVLPGGGEGTENLRQCPALAARLHRQKAEGRLVCAICAAPTVLVSAEVLDPGTHVTCYPSCEGALDRPCAGAAVVEDGLFITGRAPGSALLFALVVLKALVGERAARAVASDMVTDVL